MKLSVCSANIGGNIADYELLSKGTGQELPKDANECKDLFQKMRTSCAGLLVEQPIDVFFLQEAYDHPLLQSLLKDQKFTLTGCDGKYKDTLIALDNDRFDDINNISFKIDSEQVAVAIAKDKESGKRCIFVSLHCPGFNLDPQIKDPSKEIGDEFTKKAQARINELAKLYDVDIVAVGVDLNAFINDSRLNSFRNSGYRVFRTNQNTAAYKSEPKSREIDCILVLDKSLISRVTSIFRSSVKDFQAEVVKGFALDIYANSSDHIPIKAEIDL